MKPSLDEVLEQMMPTIKYFAKKYGRNHYDDCVSVGYFWLLRNYQTYDPEISKIGTFFTDRIRWRILEYMRQYATAITFSGDSDLSHYRINPEPISSEFNSIDLLTKRDPENYSDLFELAQKFLTSEEFIIVDAVFRDHMKIKEFSRFICYKSHQYWNTRYHRAIKKLQKVFEKQANGVIKCETDC